MLYLIHVFVYFYVCISVPDVLPLETCLAFDGIPHRHFVSKPTCCNKKCGQCGGNDCGKYTDASGKKLGRNQCCGVDILEKGEFCGNGKQDAPCKIQFTEKEVLDYLSDAVSNIPF